MPDVVALASVISSGVVAVGGLLVNYRAGREQRSHESRLAFEARAWEVKSDSLLSVIAASRHLVDSISSSDVRMRMSRARIIAETRKSLDEAVPAIETYAAEDCRKAFDDLRKLLYASGVEEFFLQKIDARLNLQQDDAATAESQRLAAQVRDAFERENPLIVGPEVIVARAEAVIAAARESLGG